MSARSSGTGRRPWLLNLYPRAWRRRYGDEVAEMLAGRAFSLRTSIDLIAGAIDVWLHPSATLAATMAAQTRDEESTMFRRIAGFECALGANVTKADERRAAIVMMAGTLLLTPVWIGAHRLSGGNQYVESLSMMAFFIPLLFSLRYTQLKGRPPAVQAIFIGGLSLVVTAIMLAAGWLASQI